MSKEPTPPWDTMTMSPVACPRAGSGDGGHDARLCVDGALRAADALVRIAEESRTMSENSGGAMKPVDERSFSPRCLIGFERKPESLRHDGGAVHGLLLRARIDGGDIAVRESAANVLHPRAADGVQRPFGYGRAGSMTTSGWVRKMSEAMVM